MEEQHRKIQIIVVGKKRFSRPICNKSEDVNQQRIYLKEELEDIKGAIRIRISKKNRQHNGQKKKYKRTNNDHQSIHIKLKIE
jgi:hypothetical protein